LVSELMLQQTVVATVVPYFERFLGRFPDLASLAAAPEEEVLAAWSGLGYYARARNLHRAARVVVAEHAGELPRDERALRALPGVGEYTAAAVAAIAFGVRTFALDGNGARVMARLAGVSEPLQRPQTRARLRAFGQELVPATRAGDFNQAVMELGALICVPREPRCQQCPIRRHCVAHATGRASEIPGALVQPTRQVVRIACALVERAGKILLVRRQAGELLAGTWALPSAVLPPGAKQPARAARAAAAARGVKPGTPRFRGRVRHIFTHRDLTAEIYQVPALSLAQPPSTAPADHHRWVDPSRLEALAISSFTRKTLRAAIKVDIPLQRP
jgi:A/G-specific adenine glycosylase